MQPLTPLPANTSTEAQLQCVSSAYNNPQPRHRYMQTAPGIMNSRTEVAHLAVALYALEKCRI